MMIKNSVIFISITALLGTGLWLMTNSTEQDAQQQRSLVRTIENSQATETITVPGTQETDSTVYVSTPKTHDQLLTAQSLRGTEIDGALKATPDGKLILDQDIRDFFDYFLSTADEIGPENAIAEIQRYIDGYLPEPAAKHAHQLLSKLLQYKQFELQIQQQPLDGSPLSNQDALVVLRNSFESQQAKRAELFTEAENQALFGLEQAYQQYTLETLEAFADESLSDEERRLKLDQLSNNLPADLQASRAEDVAVRQQQRQFEQLSNEATDDAEYHQALIEQGNSQQKADELVSYRQAQQEFERTYQQYRVAANNLDVKDPSFEQNLESLRLRFFSQPEQQTKARLWDLSASTN